MLLHGLKKKSDRSDREICMEIFEKDMGLTDMEIEEVIRLKAGKPRVELIEGRSNGCLLYTSPSPRDKRQSRMPSSA